MKKRVYAMVGLAAAGCLLLSGCSSMSTVPVQLESKVESTVVVSASGEKTVTPDLAELAFGIVTENEEAAAANDENSRQINAVIDKLKELGVAEEAIQTDGYSMYPVYDYSDDAESPKITGYTVSTVLTVSNVAVENAGDILAAAVEAGVNTIQNISYKCSQYDALYAEVLAEAVKDAADKAQLMADAAGMSVVRLSAMEEGYQNRNYTSYGTRSVSTMDNDMTSMQIMPGEITISASVTATYIVE